MDVRCRDGLTPLGSPALTPKQVDRATRGWKPACASDHAGALTATVVSVVCREIAD